MLLAFGLPLLLMIILYACLGIYPGSARSILASDAFSQFSNFHASLNQVFKGDESLFYTFNAGLGLNYYALISYYLGGLFTPLVVFFPNTYMPDALYCLTLLKIASAGLACWVFAKEMYPKLNTYLRLALSTSYSLMSFALAQSELIMWLDTFIYLPLIILGIQRLFAGKKPTVLFISYLCLFISNYYFGFMVGVFSVLYFIVRYCHCWKEHRKLWRPYLATSFLAGSASMVMILPMFLDLRNNGETLTQLTKLKTEATGLWDLVAKNMVGIYDTTKYGSIPFIYVGLLPLIFALFYFFLRRKTWGQKIGFLCIAAFLVASFYFEPLNLAWHGFHSPNMFLFRYSFLFSFLIILLSGYGLEAWNRKNSLILAGITGFLMLLFSCFWWFHKEGTYVYVQGINYYLTILLLAVYLLYFLLYHFTKVKGKLIFLLCATTMLVEASTNGYFMLEGILEDWNYASRSLYTQPRNDIEQLVAESKKESQGVKYRLENLDPISMNDSLNFGYSGVGLFSSIRNRNSSEVMNQLGFRARGTALNAHYENNTLLMDSLFAIRYNISRSPVTKFGFTPLANAGEYELFENRYALPLGVKTTNAFQSIPWVETDNLGCQTQLVNALSGQQLQYYTATYPKLLKAENSTVKTAVGKVTFNAKDKSKEQSLIYEVNLQGPCQAYLSLFPSDFGQIDGVDATVSMIGGGHQTSVKMTGQYYNLGYFKQNTKLKFRLTLKGKPTASFVQIPVISLDLNAYQKAMQHLQKAAVDFKQKGRHLTATVNMKDKESEIFTTIPYDKGWSLWIDSKKAKLSSFRKGFLCFSVPKGKHQIELSFYPQGLKVGIVLFVSCTFGFILYNRRYRAQNYIITKEKVTA